MTSQVSEDSIISGAPGCFGAASCFSSDSEVCKQCPASSQCLVEVGKTLERIKGVLNVTDYIKKHEKAKAAAKKQVEEAAAERQVTTMPLPGKKVERKTKVEAITYELTAEQNELVATLPVKAQSFVVQLCKTGLASRIRADLARGENPMTECGPKWLALTIDCLIKGPVSKSDLKSTFVDAFGWTPETAASHTSLAFKIFPALDIAKMESSKMIANPDLFKSNETK